MITWENFITYCESQRKFFDFKTTDIAIKKKIIDMINEKKYVIVKDNNANIIEISWGTKGLTHSKLLPNSQYDFESNSTNYFPVHKN